MQKNTIRNINLYQTDYKFNRNMEIIASDKYQIYMIPINYSIHKYAMTNKHIDKTSIFIFNASLINNEIEQFIENTQDKIDIYILLDQNKEKTHIRSYDKVKYIEEPKYLVNKHLYQNSTNLIEKKNNRAIYFHDNRLSNIYAKLAPLLYPNTDMNINIFDSPDLKHPFNLGYIDEIEKKDILFDSDYYIHNNDNYYVPEALLAGCKCLNLDSDTTILEQINNSQNTNYYSNIQKQTIDYSNFLEDIIYG